MSDAKSLTHVCQESPESSVMRGGFSISTGVDLPIRYGQQVFGQCTTIWGGGLNSSKSMRACGSRAPRPRRRRPSTR